jgi:SAM-dependent methyltransferase
MLLSNNPELDAEQLERKLNQLSEFRRRAETGDGEPQPALHFVQEASHAIVALEAAAPAPAPEATTGLEPVTEPSAPATTSAAEIPAAVEIVVTHDAPAAAASEPVADIFAAVDIVEAQVAPSTAISEPADEIPARVEVVEAHDAPCAPAAETPAQSWTVTEFARMQTDATDPAPEPEYAPAADFVELHRSPFADAIPAAQFSAAAPAPVSILAEEIEPPYFADAMAEAPVSHPEVTPMSTAPEPPPPPLSPLRRKFKAIRAWLGNLRHLNSRLFDLNANARNLQTQIGELEKLRANIAALEKLPLRIDALERLPLRIDALERLPARIAELEQLPSRIAALEQLPSRIVALEQLPTRIDALERLQPRIDALEQLPSRIDALEHLQPRIDALEQLPVRIDHLEKLSPRIDELEKLPAQVNHLTTSTNALHETNLGVFLRLDTQDMTNQGVQDRLGWLEALKLGQRLSQLDQTNIANRLNRLDALDISNRLNAWDLTNVANRLHRFDEYRIGERLEHLDAMLKTVLDRNLERDNRIAALVKKFRNAPVAQQGSAPTADSAPALVSHADIDQFYVEFEGLFRGSPDDIRERLKVYLPYVEALANDPSALVVDVGCGRGEWLGLLHEQGVRALGIDMNAAMVELCRERGLDAECTDAISWLQAQPAGSVALISGFHLIEHLPFETLLALFDAALHALRPDGMLIFETPNPENLVVGACHFYYDPTHRNPIVPAVAEFMARQRGFARAEILRVNAYPDSYLLDEDSEVAIRVNRAFYGAQDFAVLAWKTHAA